ncbi:HdaA/DnaA family protein [Bartonella tamiae]|uniref:Hda lid domain-containing protein n=1 Tax=Bartonella tamiae Th239 TaxID=1094558 RepID=J0ZK33_9HYPH|nr:DnaA/Hda family protein [Bartonella tamiae]EJF88693.1 hypothetical protein ME5_01244 [Bartonella tamiae Th239]EJF95057.1 hypothetical protein MEG_00638 [Bartonella tamiae Th307]
MNAFLEQLPFEFSNSTEFSEANLIVTKSNIAAYELIKNWPQWPSPIAVLIGPAGSGKSYFAHVWANLAHAHIMTNETITDAISSFDSARPLLIEDIDCQTIDEVGLFHLFNLLKQANSSPTNATLMLTATTGPSSWTIQLQDLISRLKSVTLAKINYPDDELLQKVAFKLFADRQIAIDSAVIEYLIRRCERSLFSLKKSIRSIDQIALQRKSKVTKSIISEVLNETTHYPSLK